MDLDEISRMTFDDVPFIQPQPGEIVDEPRYDLPVSGVTGLPLSYPNWTEEQRREYRDACAMDGPPGFEAEVLDAAPVTE